MSHSTVHHSSRASSFHSDQILAWPQNSASGGSVTVTPLRRSSAIPGPASTPVVSQRMSALPTADQAASASVTKGSASSTSSNAGGCVSPSSSSQRAVHAGSAATKKRSVAPGPQSAGSQRSAAAAFGTSDPPGELQ